MAMVGNFTQIPNEVFQAQKLSVRAIGLYAYLKYRSFSGNAQKSFPSQITIMKDLKIGNKGTLRKLLNELVVNNFLEMKRGSVFTGNTKYFLKKPQK